MPFIILIIAIVAVVLIISNSKKKSRTPAPSPRPVPGPVPTPPPGPTSPPGPSPVDPFPDSGSSVKYSLNFKKEEKQHVTIQVLKYVPTAGIWACPNCETENSNAESVCCVCHRGR